MNVSRAFSLVLLLTSANVSAQAAAVFATGGVYGGPEQHKAYCYVFNPAPIRSINILSSDIIKQDGTFLSISPNDNTCHPTTSTSPVALPAQKTCIVAAEIEKNSTYGCRIVIQGKNPKARGTFDIRDIDENVLTNSPLR